MPVLVVDCLTTTSAIALLLRFGHLRYAHPAVSYLLFHLVIVSSRYVSLMVGANPLFANSEILRALTIEEIERAVLISDAVLVSVVIGVITAERWRIAAPRSIRLKPELIWFTS